MSETDTGEQTLSPATGGDRASAKWVAVWAAVVASAGAIIVAIISRPGSAPSQPAPIPSPSATPSSSTGSSATSSPPPSQSASSTLALPRGMTLKNPPPKLTEANLCSWRLGTNPVPVVSVNPFSVPVDDRCNYPSDPNPKTDTPTRIFSSPNRERNPIASVHDGDVVTVKCFSHGELTSDGAQNKSDLWLYLTKPAGFMPDVNVGGGFTEKELHEVGIQACHG
jgi:hypothetical protein